LYIDVSSGFDWIDLLLFNWTVFSSTKIRPTDLRIDKLTEIKRKKTDFVSKNGHH